MFYAFQLGKFQHRETSTDNQSEWENWEWKIVAVGAIVRFLFCFPKDFQWMKFGSHINLHYTCTGNIGYS